MLCDVFSEMDYTMYLIALNFEPLDNGRKLFFFAFGNFACVIILSSCCFSNCFQRLLFLLPFLGKEDSTCLHLPLVTFMRNF